MNNPKKPFAPALIFSFFLFSFLLAGEPRREGPPKPGEGGGPPQWDPSKYAEELKKESQFIKEKAEKAPPEVAAKMRQIIDLNEKIAALCDKQLDAMKKKNRGMFTQASRAQQEITVKKQEMMEALKKEYKLHENEKKPGGEPREPQRPPEKNDKDKVESRTPEPESREWPSYDIKKDEK